MERHTASRLLATLALLLLLLTACGPAPAEETPETGLPPVARTEPPAPAPTTGPTATPLPLPSPTATLPPTPTADPGWFEPNHFFSQSDYYYYSDLLLNVGDASPVVQVTNASGWGGGLKTCETCDLVVIRYAAALFQPQNAEVSFIVALRRHRTIEEAQIALREFVDDNLQRGNSVVQPPAGSQLPAESTILTVQDVAAVATRYGSFEIWVLQEKPTSLSIEQLVAVFVSLTEIQINKLRLAGY